jgi:sugar/nucleoside kinase (ribokinase family)
VAVSKSLLDLKSALTRISSIVFSTATLATGNAIEAALKAIKYEARRGLNMSLSKN